jgi:hypothetical protein
VTVYAPAGVPGLEVVPFDPPQPCRKASPTTVAPVSNRQASRRFDTVESMPPPIKANPKGASQKAYTIECLSGNREPDGPTVLSIICAFTLPLAAGVTEVGLTEQVGGSKPSACTEQLSETELAKLLIELTVTVATSLWPGLSGLGEEVETEKSGAMKVAVTDWSPFMVTAQLVVPEHEPLQPVKVDPEAADWLNVTTVPGI